MLTCEGRNRRQGPRPFRTCGSEGEMTSVVNAAAGVRRLRADAEGTVAAPRRRALARLLSAAVFSALVAILPLAAAPYGSVEPWWTALFDASVFLLAALWAVEGALAGRWLTPAHVVTVPALLLAGWALLQSVPLPSAGAISFDPYESRLVAARLL